MSMIDPRGNPRRWPARLAAVLVVAILTSVVLAQDGEKKDVGDRESQGLSREQMWSAPTEADWKKPCLIQWQRTWADALAVAKETGKPILVCVNMDGEIASEHYAGKRYRQPEVVALYEPYVCVIASTYRHNPRDYDDEGKRILCPRFGSVTCGEHIWIEPLLYEKFFDGQRVAPRHIMVELDDKGGEEKYDVFFTWDTASVFDSVREGIETREARPPTVVRGDRSIVERVASRDIQDREAVEAAYREGDAGLRQSLLEAARNLGGDAPVDLLRQAIFGLDADLSKLARTSLAASESTKAVDLIEEALRVPLDEAERGNLIDALARLGESSPRAAWLAVVQKGLGGRSESVDASAWARAQEEYEEHARAAKSLRDVDEQRASRAAAFRANSKDPQACIELAESSLDLAFRARRTTEHDPRMARVFERHLFDEARQTALQAEKLEATPWRVNTVLAIAEYYTGDVSKAYARAEAAVKGMPTGDPSWNAHAVLSIFAEGRWTAIKKAMAAKEPMRSQWLADVNATYAALRKHPHGSDRQVVWHLDFLAWLGAYRQVGGVLREGVERFPASSILHARLRRHLLMTRGLDAVEPAYERLLEKVGPNPRLSWFAGYASTVTAEFQRRARRLEKALAAYDRGIARFESAVEGDPALASSTDHRLALALAGRARVSLEKGDHERALADILASFARRASSAGSTDGLGITPAATAQALLAKLVETKQDGLVEDLRKAIGELDPELLPKD